MTALTVNPNITVLIDPETNKVVSIATNVASEIKVTVTANIAEFDSLALGKTFVVNSPEPVTYENC